MVATDIDPSLLSQPIAPPDGVLLPDDDTSHMRASAPVTAREPAPLRPLTVLPGDPEYVVDEADPDDELAALRRRKRELDRAGEIQLLKSELHKRERDLATAKRAYDNVPKADPIRDAPTTYILMPQDVGEERIAKAWIEEHCPIKKQQQAMDVVLDINLLRKDDAVICMIRGARREEALTRLEHFPDARTGAFMHKERDRFELFADITLTPAVFIKDHWQDGAGLSRYMGRLDRNSLMRALGLLTSPLRPVWLDANESVKGKEPQYLVLRDM
jgi:hypothetical protein